MCILFAATLSGPHPGTRAYGGMARATATRTIRGRNPRRHWSESATELVGPHWGEGRRSSSPRRPGAQSGTRAFFARLERSTAQPRDAPVAWSRCSSDIDVRDVVPAVQVPGAGAAPSHDPARQRRQTGVGSRSTPRRAARRAARRGSHRGNEEADVTIGEIQEFLTGARTRSSRSGRCAKPCCSPTSSTRPARRRTSATAWRRSSSVTTGR